MHVRSKAHASKKASNEDAARWRRFLSSSPPLNDLIEIRRLHDTKTILRRRAELPPSFPLSGAEWRPGR